MPEVPLDPMHLPNLDEEVYHLASTQTGAYMGHSHNDFRVLLEPFLPKGGSIEADKDGAIILDADGEPTGAAFAAGQSAMKRRMGPAEFFSWLLVGKINAHGGTDMQCVNLDDLLSGKAYFFDPKSN